MATEAATFAVADHEALVLAFLLTGSQAAAAALAAAVAGDDATAELVRRAVGWGGPADDGWPGAPVDVACYGDDRPTPPAVWAALARLAPRARAALVLHHHLQVGDAHRAALLGRSARSVAADERRATAALGRRLGVDHDAVHDLVAGTLSSAAAMVPLPEPGAPAPSLPPRGRLTTSHAVAIVAGLALGGACAALALATTRRAPVEGGRATPPVAVAEPVPLVAGPKTILARALTSEGDVTLHQAGGLAGMCLTRRTVVACVVNDRDGADPVRVYSLVLDGAWFVVAVTAGDLDAASVFDGRSSLGMEQAALDRGGEVAIAQVPPGATTVTLDYWDTTGAHARTIERPGGVP